MYITETFVKSNLILTMAKMKSIRRRQIFIHDEYTYAFNSFNFDNTEQFWRCRHENHNAGRIYTSVETSKVI